MPTVSSAAQTGFSDPSWQETTLGRRPLLHEITGEGEPIFLVPTAPKAGHHGPKPYMERTRFIGWRCSLTRNRTQTPLDALGHLTRSPICARIPTAAARINTRCVPLNGDHHVCTEHRNNIDPTE